MDPIEYYENRYFPLGFDDPEKLTVYQRNKVSDSTKATIEKVGTKMRDQKVLARIKEFEKKCDEQTERDI